MEHDERELARLADCLIAVSTTEADTFRAWGCKQVITLGHDVIVTPTSNDFSQRGGMLFVGALSDMTSPNVDSILWFVEAILPLIKLHFEQNIQLTLVGRTAQALEHKLRDYPNVILKGEVSDLTPFYDKSRIFVAPTRIASGLPRKVHDAAAHGVPVVATTLLGLLTGWDDGETLSLADTPTAFALSCIDLYSDENKWQKLRANSLNAANTLHLDFRKGKEALFDYIQA